MIKQFKFKWWHSVKWRVAFVSFIFFILTIGGVAIDRWNMKKIDQNMAFLERNSEFLNDVLETRRYEKNFFLYKEKEAYKNTLVYIQKARYLLGENKKEIQKLIGFPYYEKLEDLINQYQELFSHLNPHGNGVKSQKLRKIGKEIVDVSVYLNKRVKHDINKALSLSKHITFYFGFVVVFMASLLIYIVGHQIIRPLHLIQQSAGRISRGDFSLFPKPKETSSEINVVVDALNKMIQELDLRQQEIIQSKKMASIGTLTAGIAHELNNPLNNILITAELFLEEFEKDLNSEQKQYLVDILQQARRCTDIVGNLLDFSRARPLTKEKVNIQKIVNDVVKLFQNQMRLNHIELEVDMVEDLPFIKGDPTSLRQIFINLIENAIQAMPKGGSLLITGLREDNFIKIEIADTGQGIPEEYLSRIFEPFFTTKPNGTGLGLAVTYGIIKKHKGKLLVDTKVNEGTTFTILLPVET